MKIAVTIVTITLINEFDFGLKGVRLLQWHNFYELAEDDLPGPRW